MANLYITEFKRMAEDARGRSIPVGELPAITGQVVTYTSSTNSVPFHKQTRFLRLIADADAYIAVGSGTQTATANSALKLEADVAEYFGIDGVKGMQLAVYDGSS